MKFSNIINNCNVLRPLVKKFFLVILISLVCVFIAAFNISQPGLFSVPEQDVSYTITPSVMFMLPDVRTPLPPEFLENKDQTNGILFGGILLVMIVVGGTLTVIWRRRK